MNRLLRQRTLRDAALFTALALLLWWAGSTLDLHERLDAFFAEHEGWNLDETFTALMAFGLMGFFFGSRRILDLGHEILRRRAAESEASWIAQHDVLTRLPNRRFVDDYLQPDSKTSPRRQMTAFMIDLDGFKQVNDLLGHAAGDKVLVTVAERLTALLPQALVARQGGDEFLVLIAEDLNDRAAGVARSIVEAIATPLAIDGTRTEVGASVGFARLPHDVSDTRQLLQAVDLAMYAAKKSGRNLHRSYDQDLGDAAAERNGNEIELRQALRAGTIRPYFQPLIDLKSSKIIGFEALARWTRSDGVEVEPLSFIQLAEDLGLIVELSDHLLRLACREAMLWPGNLMLSFNISPAQLTDPLLGLRILKILAETGLVPQRLEIEITESTFVRDTETAIAVMHELKNAGIRIALDDFGTGYSNLSQVTELAVDRLKIDRSFVASCIGDERQMSIVKAIVSMSRSLGLTATAEGIENAGQLDGLRAIGCEVGQGFLFSKAIPAAEIPALLNAQSPVHSAMGA